MGWEQAHRNVSPSELSRGGQAGPGGVTSLLYFLSQDEGSIVMIFQRHLGLLGHVTRTEGLGQMSWGLTELMNVSR